MPKIKGWSRDPFNEEGKQGEFGKRSKILKEWGQDNGDAIVRIQKYRRAIKGDVSNGMETVYKTNISDPPTTFSDRTFKSKNAAEKRATNYMRNNPR